MKTLSEYPLAGKQVLLADDVDFMREGAAVKLEEVGLSVRGCASGDEVWNMLSQYANAFDAVIMDLYGMDKGKEFAPERDIPKLLQHFPNLPFIIFSVEVRMARQYLEAGVHGYVYKDDQADHLIIALEYALLKNEVYCSPTIRQNVWDLLTLQDRELLQMASKGYLQKEIATEFGVNERKIENQIRRIRGKLDAQNITQAVAIALKQGIIR